jgi:hypothetical protein
VAGNAGTIGSSTSVTHTLSLGASKLNVVLMQLKSSARAKAEVATKSTVAISLSTSISKVCAGFVRRASSNVSGRSNAQTIHNLVVKAIVALALKGSKAERFDSGRTGRLRLKSPRVSEERWLSRASSWQRPFPSVKTAKANGPATGLSASAA